MGILDFEGYELEYLQQEGGYYDDNGDYNPGVESWISVGRCNAVPSGRHNIISTPDGQQVAFSFTINIHDPLCREFTYGEKLRLTTIHGMELYYLSVKGFARYQHQCKIYA